MGIAFAIDGAGRHMTPETAAELARLRARVAELEDEKRLGEGRERDELLTRFERALTPFCADPQAAAAAVTAVRDHEAEFLLRDAQRLQDRVTELESREATVTKFVAARAEYVTAIRNCHPDNGHDYDRWQGHAAARRQLATQLGLPVAWPAETEASVQKSTDKLTRLLAPTQALREDPHDSPLHHAYKIPHDLPPVGGQ